MKNEELQEQVQLVRIVESNLHIEVPTEEDQQFRASLLSKVQTELPLLPRTLVVRLFESACAVKFPDATVNAFRSALNKHIGTALNLRQYRPATPPTKR